MYKESTKQFYQIALQTLAYFIFSEISFHTEIPKEEFLPCVIPNRLPLNKAKFIIQNFWY